MYSTPKGMHPNPMLPNLSRQWNLNFYNQPQYIDAPEYLPKNDSQFSNYAYNAFKSNSATNFGQPIDPIGIHFESNDDILRNPKRHPRKKFSNEEDLLLLELVHKYGENNWRIIADEMPGRNVRQCHDRWVKYLSPDINTDSWSEEEDKLLKEKYNEHGSQWKLISSYFPNRTDISIRNRWQVQCRRNAKLLRQYSKQAQMNYFRNELDQNKLADIFLHYQHIENAQKFTWTTPKTNKKNSENSEKKKKDQPKGNSQYDEEDMLGLFLDEWIMNQDECL